jgi:KDO2-lipid IV(A) lauroyltransferase
MSLEARTRLSRETFRHAGLSFMELALWRKLVRRREYVAIEGASALDDAVAAGRGCIAVSGHLGNWELLAATIAARYPLTVVAREVNDRHFQRLIFDFRTAAGAEVLLRDDDSFWQAVRGALKRGRIVALLIDQDTRGAGVFVPFFGRPAHTPHGAALLALRARVPVVTAFVERRPEGGHLIRLTPIPTGPTSGGRSRVLELTARLTAAIEAQIRRAPAEWVWWHERWRRQPPAGGAQQAGDYLYSPGTPW